MSLPILNTAPARTTSSARTRSVLIDELERHRDTGGAGAGGLGDSLAKPEPARKFHDDAVRSLPEERAAEIAARTLALPDAQSVEDLAALLASAGER
jgi:hypothetical protein